MTIFDHSIFFDEGRLVTIPGMIITFFPSSGVKLHKLILPLMRKIIVGSRIPAAWGVGSVTHPVIVCKPRQHPLIPNPNPVLMDRVPDVHHDLCRMIQICNVFFCLPVYLLTIDEPGHIVRGPFKAIHIEIQVGIKGNIVGSQVRTGRHGVHIHNLWEPPQKFNIDLYPWCIRIIIIVYKET